MRLLTVNAGSSSIRLAVFAMENGGPRRLASHHGGAEPARAQEVLRGFLAQHEFGAIEAVAHRVVHGGEKLVRTCLVDAQAEQEIERLCSVAPLHNPAALAWIRACRAVLGAAIAQVAAFDTAFYAQLPEVARTYGLPRALAAEHGLRRFGFHGLAHRAMWRRWRQLDREAPQDARTISLQLGAGCSITAARAGGALDTSMGFSPLEGLVMATRSGDIDPGLLLHLQLSAGMTPERLATLLNEESGLRGVSGGSADMRSLLASSEPAARLAVDLYCYRARKYLGAYLAVLGGAEAILFGGGVGENAPEIRARVLAGLEWAGIEVDAARNAAPPGSEVRIHSDASRIAAWVIPVDEAMELAREAVAVLQPGGDES
jgi:acetate kinase